MTTRTTKADLARLVQLIEADARALDLIEQTDTLHLYPPVGAVTQYRLNVRPARGYTRRFGPADGDGGSIGATPKEAARTLKVIYDTLRAVRYGKVSDRGR